MATICDMLATNARLYPDDIALIETAPGKKSRREITWKEFDDNANKVANVLIGWGIRKDDKVIHWMRNSISWLETYFGIIRTGAWAVPLNFRFTPADFKYCADVAEAKAMILGEDFVQSVQAVRSQLPTIKKYVVDSQNHYPGMERLSDVIVGASTRPVNVPLGDDDECGLYFTSGTTGVPKPVLLTHKNMTFAAVIEQIHHYTKRDDNFVILPPLYHTGAKMHWFGSLISGSRATIMTEVSPQYIFDTMNREKGTIIWLLVPWVHDILVALDRGELKKDEYDFSRWRLMHIGAQPVPPSLIMHWRKYFPNMQYDNNYGLSESTGPGAVHLGLENALKPGAVGKAGHNWKLRIVNDKDEDVPQGKVGELLIKGDGVMREYYKNPEKTRDTIKDGWLHTGDMAWIDEEGYVFLVDRKKDIIITGGENIYPIEIEDALSAHPKVYDVAAIGIPDERLGEVVGVVIEPKPGETLTEAEILAFAEQKLPRYKRPRKVIFDKVPRNPTGKIEKVKLRQKYNT
jgi:acyl-CoA synthetase (AMP-forming)/AMP-acid ligase II